MRGLEARATDRKPLDRITSTASFFLSRIDSKIDPHLPEGSPLRGQVAVASARVSYASYRKTFTGPRWTRLAQLGARTQRPLWASTATKNPAYPDVLYVAQLIGPDVVNTMAVHTLRAFCDSYRQLLASLQAEPAAIGGRDLHAPGPPSSERGRKLP